MGTWWCMGRRSSCVRDGVIEEEENKQQRNGKSAVEKPKLNCLKCSHSIGNKHEIDCTECKKPTHVTCLNPVKKEKKEEYISGKKGFQCSECKRKRLGLKSIEAAVFICKVCDLRVNTETELDQHVKETHVPISSPDVNVICDQCEFTGENEDVVNKHIQETHENKCGLCEMETNSAEEMNKHMETHTKLVDNIISSMEKHLHDKCEYIEEKLEVERLAKKKLQDENSKLVNDKSNDKA